jgi:hypothetical protein
MPYTEPKLYAKLRVTVSRHNAANLTHYACSIDADRRFIVTETAPSDAMPEIEIQKELAAKQAAANTPAVPTVIVMPSKPIAPAEPTEQQFKAYLQSMAVGMTFKMKREYQTRFGELIHWTNSVNKHNGNGKSYSAIVTQHENETPVELTIKCAPAMPAVTAPTWKG